MCAKDSVPKSVSCGGIGRILLATLVLVSAMALTAGGQSQDLTATFSTPTGMVTATSAYAYDSDTELFTVTDTVTMPAPGPSVGALLCGFAWFGMNMDGSQYPKIFAGSLWFSGDGSSLQATQTWQTTSNLQISPGVIFFGMPMGQLLPTSSNMWLTSPAATATWWAMGPQTPIVADASLDATMGLDKKVKLTSAIHRKGKGYEYTYRIKNETDEPISVKVPAASLNVKLNKGKTYVHKIQSDRIGLEVEDVAMVNSKGLGQVGMRANVIVPMPKPRPPKVVTAAKKKESSSLDS